MNFPTQSLQGRYSGPDFESEAQALDAIVMPRSLCVANQLSALGREALSRREHTLSKDSDKSSRLGVTGQYQRGCVW